MTEVSAPQPTPINPNPTAPQTELQPAQQPPTHKKRNLIIAASLLGVIILLGLLQTILGRSPLHPSTTNKGEVVTVPTATTKPTSFYGYPASEFGTIPVVPNTTVKEAQAILEVTPSSDTTSTASASSLSVTPFKYDAFLQYLAQVKSLGYTVNAYKILPYSYQVEVFKGNTKIAQMSYSDPDTSPTETKDFGMQWAFYPTKTLKWPSKAFAGIPSPYDIKGLQFGDRKTVSYTNYGSDAGGPKWSLAMAENYSSANDAALMAYAKRSEFASFGNFSASAVAKDLKQTTHVITGNTFEANGTNAAGDTYDINCSTIAMGKPCLFQYTPAKPL